MCDSADCMYNILLSDKDDHKPCGIGYEMDSHVVCSCALYCRWIWYDTLVKDKLNPQEGPILMLSACVV